MFWKPKPNLKSAVAEEVAKQLAERDRVKDMGPVEREIDPLIQYGWTFEDMRKAFRLLARAIDRQNKT